MEMPFNHSIIVYRHVLTQDQHFDYRIIKKSNITDLIFMFLFIVLILLSFFFICSSSKLKLKSYRIYHRIFFFFYICYFMSHQPLGLLATSEEAGLYIIVKHGMFQIE